MSQTGSLDTLTPIFCTGYYFLALTVNVLICVGINVGLDIWAASKEDEHYVVSGANIFNMLLFSIIVSFFTFWNAKQTHKRIQAGDAVPVTRRALCDNCFKKVILFSMQEPNWKKRIFLFMWNCFLFPGVVIVIVVTLLCMFATGFESMGSANSCKVDSTVNIVVIACWKACGMVVIFSMQYAASHNEEQPEIAEALGSTHVLVTALGGSADDIYQQQPNQMA